MNDKIKQFIVFGVASVVALALCLGVLVVTVNNLGEEATVADNKEIVNKTQLTSSKKVMAQYINNLISETDNRFIKTKTYTDVSVNDLKVLNFSEHQTQDEALFNFAKDRMLHTVDDFYEADYQGLFEKNDSKKLSIKIDEGLLKKADFSIGQVNENGESQYDDEGNLVDSEYYYLTYNIDVNDKAFSDKYAGMFSVENDLSAKEQFINAVKADCEISDFEAVIESITINAKVNRENDQLQYINVIRSYAVTLDAEFMRTAAIFCEKKISFVYTVTDTYEYSYAGISFVEDEVAIDADGNVYVNAELLDEPYVTEKCLGDCNLEFPYKVPGTGYFVMGDQRTN